MEPTTLEIGITAESLFEEMTLPEIEDAFAGHSCLCWAAEAEPTRE
ncbi:azolemycin family RiPP peptide [Streptomyces sp. NPDC016845]